MPAQLMFAPTGEYVSTATQVTRSASVADPASLRSPARQNLSFDAVCNIGPEGGGGQGSFMKPGYVLTAWHVISANPRPLVINSDGEKTYGTVVYGDPEHDIAVLALDAPIGRKFVRSPATEPQDYYKNDSMPEFQIISRHAVEGKRVIATSPFYQGSLAQTPQGMICQPYYIGYGSVIPVIPGDSGSPIVDRKGRIVSLVSARANMSAEPGAEPKPLWDDQIKRYGFYAPPIYAVRRAFAALEMALTGDEYQVRRNPQPGAPNSGLANV